MQNHMKIYFAGSIRGGREDLDLYYSLIEYLKHFGEVLSEHVGESNLTSSGEEGEDDHMIHNRDMDWLMTSDLIIAEVSTPSIGVGYEIGRAIENQKPILCLYRQDAEKELSAMIGGSQELTVITYQNFETAKDAINTFMTNLFY